METKVCYYTLFLVLFVGGMFSVIYYNGHKHTQYLKEFEQVCSESGGYMFVPKGVKGWAVPECRKQPNIEVIITNE